MKKVFSLTLLVVVAFSALSFSAVKEAQVEQRQVPSFIGYVEDEIVIKFDRSMLQEFNFAEFRRGRFGVEDLDAIAEQYRSNRILQQFPRAERKFYRGQQVDLRTWFKVRFAQGVDVDAAVADFMAKAGVLEVQKIGIHAVSATPNDGNYSSQWHLNQSNDHDIDAPEAWDVETGDESVIVAILDTGVRYFHKDLGGANASYDTPTNVDGNMWVNWAEKNGTDGVDDDNNGYVDDWIGWDFVDGVTPYQGEDGSTPDNDPRDFNGHGTHCAGNVSAINNNGYATAAPSGGWGTGSLTADGNGVKTMAMRIGYSGRYFIFEVGYVRMDFAAEALYYAADNGAKIASCSWGSSDTGGLGDAIDYFLASGGLIFKAAGNDGNENTDYMTARSDIISVAATDQNDVKSSFSSYGSWVDISAPGTAIYSLYHDHNDPENDYVAALDGTSMATPLAASVAGLIWSKNPGWSASDVEQHLYDTADDIYGLSGNSSYQNKLGAGRINAFAAVQGGGGTPAPVAAFSGSPTSGCAPLTVTFTDQSTGDITSWSWDFGDGSTSTLQNPSHEYTAPGTYTVALTVTGPGGSDTETKTDYISVSTVPTAQFSGTPTTGTAPLTVSFTDESTGSPTSWSWDFGDGGTSTQQNPSYEYASAGTYTVTLTATNSCGSDIEEKVDYITVEEPTCDPPVAAFTGSPTTGTAPLTVSFADQSSNSPTSWSWDFGDGGTSTQENPSYTYDTAGIYTVALTATNSCGSDTETKTDYITVSEPSTENALHVGDIEVTKSSFWRWTQATARVRVLDQNGNPVESATVEGEWSGSASGTASFQTGSDGWGETTTSWVRGGDVYTFCVTNLSKSGYVYDSDANVATCASSDGSTSQVLTSISPDEMKKLEEQTGEKLVYSTPNPFNPSTQINFLLPEASNVTLEIYNILGERINTLYDQRLEAGVHTARWNATDNYGRAVSSGTYFYVLKVNADQMVRGKLLYLK